MLNTHQLLALHLLVLDKQHDLAMDNLTKRLENMDLPFAQVVKSISANYIDDEIERLEKRAETEIAKAAELGISILTFVDPRYPRRLKKLANAPLILFAKGDLAALNTEQSLAVVGSRDATETAKIAAREIAKQVADTGACIVSGLAVGCDTAAHLGALESEVGKTIAVLANGLDKVFPEENIPLAEQIIASGGCLVSIYPIGVIPNKDRYYDRNGIQTGLADATVIVQAAKEQCGTMVTAKHCRNQGRTLFCFDPKKEADEKLRREQYKGNEKLINGKIIKNRAIAIADADVIMHHLNARLNKTFPIFFTNIPKKRKAVTPPESSIGAYPKSRKRFKR